MPGGCEKFFQSLQLLANKAQRLNDFCGTSGVEPADPPRVQKTFPSLNEKRLQVANAVDETVPTTWVLFRALL
jgi:hypothetical protein